MPYGEADISRLAREQGIPTDPAELAQYARDRGLNVQNTVSYAGFVRAPIIRELVMRNLEAQGISTGSTVTTRAEAEQRRADLGFVQAGGQSTNVQYQAAAAATPTRTYASVQREINQPNLVSMQGDLTEAQAVAALQRSYQAKQQLAQEAQAQRSTFVPVATATNILREDSLSSSQYQRAGTFDPYKETYSIISPEQAAYAQGKPPYAAGWGNLARYEGALTGGIFPDVSAAKRLSDYEKAVAGGETTLAAYRAQQVSTGKDFVLAGDPIGLAQTVEALGGTSKQLTREQAIVGLAGAPFTDFSAFVGAGIAGGVYRAQEAFGMSPTPPKAEATGFSIIYATQKARDEALKTQTPAQFFVSELAAQPSRIVTVQQTEGLVPEVKYVGKSAFVIPLAFGAGALGAQALSAGAGLAYTGAVSITSLPVLAPIVSAAAPITGAVTTIATGIGTFVAANPTAAKTVIQVGSGALIGLSAGLSAESARESALKQGKTVETAEQEYYTALGGGVATGIAFQKGFASVKEPYFEAKDVRLPLARQFGDTTKPVQTFYGETSIPQIGVKGIKETLTYPEQVETQRFLTTFYMRKGLGDVQPLINVPAQGGIVLRTPTSSQLTLLGNIRYPELASTTGETVDAGTKAYSAVNEMEIYVTKQNLATYGKKYASQFETGTQLTVGGASERSAFLTPETKLPLETRSAGTDVQVFTEFQRQEAKKVFGAKSVEYGSYSASAQLPARLQYQAGDVDTLLINKGQAGAVKFSQKAVETLTQKGSGQFKFSLETPTAPLIVAAPKGGGLSQHAFDVHFLGQTDALGSQAPEAFAGIKLTYGSFPLEKIQGIPAEPLGEQGVRLGAASLGIGRFQGQNVVVPLRPYKAAQDVARFVTIQEGIIESKAIRGEDVTVLRQALEKFKQGEIFGVGKVSEIPALKAGTALAGGTPSYAAPQTPQVSIPALGVSPAPKVKDISDFDLAKFEADAVKIARQGYYRDAQGDIITSLKPTPSKIQSIPSPSIGTSAAISPSFGTLTGFSVTPPSKGYISPRQSPSIDSLLSPSTSPPSRSPSASVSASVSASLLPSVSASISPSISPSVSPSISPSISPSVSPSLSPSISPSVSPSVSPSISPSVSPSLSPSVPIKPPSTGIQFPTFFGGGYPSAGGRRGKIGKRKFKYTPSVTADLFNIRARVGKGAGERTFSGLEIRPVPITGGERAFKTPKSVKAPREFAFKTPKGFKQDSIGSFKMKGNRNGFALPKIQGKTANFFGVRMGRNNKRSSFSF